VDVRPLPAERDAEAAQLLAGAFFDYPTWHALAPREPGRRRSMIRRYYGAELAIARRWDGTLLAALDGQQLVGVALAFDPGRYPPPPWSLVWFGSLLLAGPGSVVRALRALSSMDAGHPQTPHLFLHTVGADPGHQRRGAGRALVGKVVEHADAQGRPAYLMTSRPDLIGFYQGFGFGSVGQLALPRGLTVWQMLREA
jgi:ribosomal protein S18 acetylase RimI-like enzyme